MKLRENILFKPERNIEIDYINGDFIIRGIDSNDKILGGIPSVKIFGNTVLVKWYDFWNLLRRLKNEGIDEARISDSASILISNISERKSRINNYFSGDIDLVKLNSFQGKLYKIQKGGVAGLLSRRVFGLFDEMGSGKTVQSI